MSDEQERRGPGRPPMLGRWVNGQRSDVIDAPLEPLAPRKRGRPRLQPKVKERRVRDWRGENRYMQWLESPPPEYAEQAAMANRVLAQLRAKAREAGFEFGPGVGWRELAKEMGLQRLQVAQMMRGRQRMPLDKLCILAAGLGLKVVLVEDDDDGLLTAIDAAADKS